MAKSRLRLGYFVPAVFWGTTIVCGAVLSEYDHLRWVVSELGARGTPTQSIFTAGMVLSALLSAIFIAALVEQCKLAGVSKVPALVLLTFTVSIGGAGIFPLPLRAHLYLGLPSVLLLLSPLLSLILWRGFANWKVLRPYAIIGLGLMLLGFFTFVPRFLPDYAGLTQRLFHAGWSVWFFGLSSGFLRVAKPGFARVGSDKVRARKIR